MHSASDSAGRLPARAGTCFRTMDQRRVARQSPQLSVLKGDARLPYTVSIPSSRRRFAGVVVTFFLTPLRFLRTLLRLLVLVTLVTRAACADSVLNISDWRTWLVINEYNINSNEPGTSISNSRHVAICFQILSVFVALTPVRPLR